jgi:Fe-S cluster biogenesis protein NfuA
MTEQQNAEMIRKVENVIDQIRPYLQADGGNIRFVELTDDNVVNVELLGACGSCPMSTMTLKAGVEQAMKKAIPEVKSVEAINLNVY